MSSNNSSNLIAIPFCYPGGVTFTFQQAPSCPCPSPNGVQTTAQYVQQPTQQLQQLQQQQQQRCQQQPPQNCNNNGQQISQIDYCTLLRQLEQHIIEKMMAQSQQQCKSYQLRFHCNAGTSTSSLLYPCQENYKTTQTEIEKTKERVCRCNCPTQLCCLHFETSKTTEAVGTEDLQCDILEETRKP
ncbi:ras guanine nucleotide exchange factor B-like [Chrysoperla carnea]|uniref:ras guanine nucleotide exchange factor B-like n=1 Tax=Chrysoperla carnea TaxID=189513 RepID=UPI001D099C67|nr:ras guanine nucleotide exchange factor B-like [Chrysoperla carnea]